MWQRDFFMVWNLTKTDSIEVYEYRWQFLTVYGKRWFWRFLGMNISGLPLVLHHFCNNKALEICQKHVFEKLDILLIWHWFSHNMWKHWKWDKFLTMISRIDDLLWLVCIFIQKSRKSHVPEYFLDPNLIGFSLKVSSC
jgi:hypothetical protein